MTKQKILVIGTGGTIGAKAGSTITADAPLKILNLYTPPAAVDLIGRAAFDRFSEHADLAYLEQLCTYMQGIDYSAYRGVVLLQAPAFHRRRILQITPHPGIDYGAFDLTGVDAVLHRMYHSATVPEPATAFAHRCKEAGVPCLFVTPKPAAAYVTAAHLPGVWTSTTPESAFAKLLLTNGQDFDTMTLQVNENR